MIQPDGIADGKRTYFDLFGVLREIVVGYGGIRLLDEASPRSIIAIYVDESSCAEEIIPIAIPE